MPKQDYYALLGVEKGADADALKKAYRTLAMKHHPDRNKDNPEAEKKFKEISEAYDVLKDPQKRAAYDRFGHAAFGGDAGGGRQGGFSGFSSQGNADFGDIFGDFFSDFMGGGGGGARGGGASVRQSGSDLRYNVSVTLEEAFKGKKETISFMAKAKCDGCSGSGAANGSKPKTCGACGGHGKVAARHGFLMIEQTCGACGGAGHVIADPCKDCRGEGRVNKEKTLSVSVPAGVDDGARVRVAGEGEAGARGGPAGDLYLFVKVAPHSLFERRGNDIYFKAHVKMTEAALGGAMEAPTVEGTKTRVTIPAGTQSGEMLRLRGKGMTVLRSGGRRGDMYVEVQVETPQKLSKRQRELLEEFEKEENGDANPKVEQFFKKLKDFWEGAA
ncbi:MAG: molecular chaperone DnaJ [Rickettsiales bacterium]